VGEDDFPGETQAKPKAIHRAGASLPHPVEAIKDSWLVGCGNSWTRVADG
jgi:hypothetical protein